MPECKKPDQPEEKPDPLSNYLERTSPRGKRVQRLDALLKHMNLQTAAALDQNQKPPEKSKKN